MLQQGCRLFLRMMFSCVFVSACAAQAAIASVYDSFETIMVDAHSVRGGNGDVAPSYLFISELLTKYQFKGRIILLVKVRDEFDRNMSKIHSGLSILQKIVPDFQRFSSRVEILDSEKFREKHFNTGLKVDLSVSFAGVNGDFQLPGAWHFPEPGEMWDEKSIYHDKTIFIQLPVFGNTENKDSVFSLARTMIGNREMVLMPPGLGSEENGVYFDHVAGSLRGKSREELRAYIQDRAISVEDTETQKRVQFFTGAESINRFHLGFLYGISIGEVRTQFFTYLEGLRPMVNMQSRPIILLTPSGVKPTGFPHQLDSYVKLISLDEPLPTKFENGKVYVVPIGGVKHDMFNALLAFSELPPIVAGDNALSAILALGKPFVMTQVKWNQKNVKNLLDRLEQNARALGLRGFQKIRRHLERGDLSVILDVRKFAPAFWMLQSQIPLLSERFISIIQSLRTGESADVNDEALKLSLDLAKLIRDRKDSELAALIRKYSDHPILSDVVFQSAKAINFRNDDAVEFKEMFSAMIELADKKKAVDFFTQDGAYKFLFSARGHEAKNQLRQFLRTRAKYASPYIYQLASLENVGKFQSELRYMYDLWIEWELGGKNNKDAYSAEKVVFYNSTLPYLEGQFLKYLKKRIQTVGRDESTFVRSRIWEVFNPGYGHVPLQPSHKVMQSLTKYIIQQNDPTLLVEFTKGFFYLQKREEYVSILQEITEKLRGYHQHLSELEKADFFLTVSQYFSVSPSLNQNAGFHKGLKCKYLMGQGY